MKILVVYYSRTGTTKKIALELANFFHCQLEEIKTKKDRSGPIGYLLAGREASLKKPAEIDDSSNDPANYDLIVIGTPVWSFTVSSPVRAYLIKYGHKFSRVAFFCTQGGSDAEKAFQEMENICQKQPIATLILKTKEVAGSEFM